MISVFVGFDPRSWGAFSVCATSLLRVAKQPISITPLVIDTLPCERVGLTAFTYTRYLVPWLMDYKGMAIYVDSDTIFLSDPSELMKLCNPDSIKSLWVVKNKQRFEWPSVIVFNCKRLKILTPELVKEGKGLTTFEFVKENEVGELPSEWNHLVGYDEPRGDAKLVHFTQGVPGYPELRGCEYTEEWIQLARLMGGMAPWAEVMGQSVHAKSIGGINVPKLAFDRIRREVWEGETKTAS